jgi:ATP/maltotriose-dependent transcriptional regulator MalT
MKELLNHAASRGITPTYVNTLLGAYNGAAITSRHSTVAEMTASTDTATAGSPASQLSGTLSVRELEVLRLIARGASSKDIAGELYISVDTAKKHIRSIYLKLDVHKQTTAVIRARELGLL